MVKFGNGEHGSEIIKWTNEVTGLNLDFGCTSYNIGADV